MGRLPRVTLQSNTSSTTTLTLTTNAPATVALSNIVTSLPENSPAVKVADIAVNDVDAAPYDNNVITLGGADAGSFQVLNGDELWTVPGLDYETQVSYQVDVSAVDSSLPGPFATESLTVTLTDAPEVRQITAADFTTAGVTNLKVERDGAVVRFYDGDNPTVEAMPAANYSTLLGIDIVAPDSSDNTIEIDVNGLGTLPITYEGGVGGNDTLVISDSGASTYSSISSTFANANDGQVALAGGPTITYTGLEPVTDNLSATDRVFGFSAVTETITLTESGGSLVINSTAGEITTFTPPSSSITINGGGGVDGISVADLTAAFSGDISVSGDAGDDVIDGDVQTETADFSGNLSDYSLSVSGGMITAVDNRGGSPDGTDTITDIEFLAFADQTISTAAPTISGVSVPADGTYNAGDDLDFTFTFDQPISTLGSETLGLTIGASSVTASVQSTTANTITFRYTVQSGDVDTDGIVIGVISGGDIEQASISGLDADLTFSPPSTASVLVDAISPIPDAGGPYTIAEGDDLMLDASGTMDPQGDPLTYLWDLDNDGSYDDASGVSPTVSWSTLDGLGYINNDGSYTIGLRVTDGTNTSFDTAALTVTNTLPAVDPLTAPTINEGDDLTITVNASDFSSLDDLILTYGWDLDGDNNFNDFLSTSGTSTIPWSTLSSFGIDDGTDTYALSVRVFDDDGQTEVSTTLTVNNVDPTLTISGAAMVDEGSLYTLSLSSSDPGDDTITGWNINWGDGSPIEMVAGNPSSVTHTFADGDATYSISATAMDDDGTYSSNTLSVMVTDVDPTLAISGASNVNEGDTYTLNLSSSDPGDDTITEWNIDWGDGSPIEMVAGDPSTATHVYADGDSTYTVSATATNEDGTFSSNSISVVVDNIAPTLNVAPAGAVTMNEGDTVTKTITSTDVMNDTITVDSGGVGTITPTGPGTWEWSYTPADDTGAPSSVTITSSDEDGGVSTFTFGLTVNNVAPTVASDMASVTIDEGNIAVMTGTYGDVGSDTVTLALGAGSVGTLTDNLDGTWTWFYNGADNGSGTVEVVATDDDSDSSSVFFTWTVNNVDPASTLGGSAAISGDEGTAVSNFGSATDVAADSPVSFTISSLSSDPVPGVFTDNGDGTWDWNWTDTDGDYSDTLIVTADDGDSGTSQVSFTVAIANVGPSVDAGADVTVDEGTTVVQTITVTDLGGADSDPTGDIVSVTQTGGAVSGTLADMGGGIWTWTYNATDQLATTTIEITVVDDEGATATDTFDLTVNDVAPTLTLVGDPTVVEEGTYTLNLSSSDPGDDTITSWDIFWGDGDSTSVTGDPASATHVYDDGDNTYTITVTAMDEEGSYTSTIMVDVLNVAPTLTVDSAMVMADEGTVATNDGTLSDVAADLPLPSGNLTASHGTVVDNLDGTWSWTYDASDGPLAYDLGAVNGGVAVEDGATGTGYIMHTASSVLTDTRFSADPPLNASGFVNSEQLIAVRYNTTSMEWEFNGNDSWETFTPVATDRLLASVDFDADTITSLQGATGMVDGINQGYTFGDLTFTANEFNGVFNEGEFTIDGTFYEVDPTSSSATVTITAEDKDGGVSTVSFDVQVKNVDPSVTLSSASVVVAEGTMAAENTITVVDVSGDTITSITASVGTLSAPTTTLDDPSMGFTTNTYTWSLANPGNEEGPITVTIVAMDEDGGTTTETFTYEFENVAPSVDAISQTSITINEGTTATNSGTFSDVPADTLTLSISPMPSGASFIDNGDGTWDWSYSPADDTDLMPNPGTFTVSAFDGVDTSTVMFDLTVENLAPSVTVATPIVVVDEGDTATNSGTILDVPADTIASVTVLSGPGTISSFDDTSWAWTYDTTAVDEGAAVVTVEVTDDDGGSSTVTFALVVNNVAPTVATPPADIVANEGDGIVSTSGEFDDAADTLTLSISPVLTGATFTDNGDGTFAFDYDALDDLPTTTLTVTGNDGTTTTSVTFDLTVNNVAPGVTADMGTVTVNEGDTATNMGTISDVPADTIASVTVLSGPGTIDSFDDTSWDWSYDTTSADQGTTTVTIEVTDDDGGVSTVMFDLVVNNVAPTVATPPADIVADEGDGIVSTSGEFGDAADTLTLSISPVLAGATFTDNGDGTFDFDYNALDDLPTTTLTVTASDGDATVSTTFDLTVNNVAPVLSGFSATVTGLEGDTVTNVGTLVDPGADTVVLTASTGTVSNVGGTVTWSYSSTDDISSPIVIIADDQDGGMDTITFSLAINNVDPTLTISGASNVDEGSTYTLNLSSSDPGDDTITQWDIDWGDGSPIETVVGDPSSATHVYADGDNTYMISATATDEDGTFSSNTISVNVDNVEPTPLVISGASMVAEGTLYTLNLSSAADPGDDMIMEWNINWGDGSPIHTGGGEPLLGDAHVCGW